MKYQLTEFVDEEYSLLMQTRRNISFPGQWYVCVDNIIQIPTWDMRFWFLWILLFLSISSILPLFINPLKIRVSWYFQGLHKETSNIKCINVYWSFIDRYRKVFIGETTFTVIDSVSSLVKFSGSVWDMQENSWIIEQ